MKKIAGFFKNNMRLVLIAAGLVTVLAASFVAFSSTSSLAVSTDADRMYFFSMDPRDVDDFREMMNTGYGGSSTVLQNYIFAGSNEVMAMESESSVSVISYLHDFTLRPASRETLVITNAYLSGNYENTLILKYYSPAGSSLYLLTENYERIAVEDINGVIFSKDASGIVTAVVNLNSSNRETLRYLEAESGKISVYKLISSDDSLTVYSIGIVSNGGTLSFARGMKGYADFLDPFAEVSYSQAAGQTVGCRYQVSGSGAGICTNVPEAVGVDDCTEGYWVSIDGGLSEEEVRKELNAVSGIAEETTEETTEKATEETTEKPTETMTEETTAESSAGKAEETAAAQADEEAAAPGINDEPAEVIGELPEEEFFAEPEAAGEYFENSEE